MTDQGFSSAVAATTYVIYNVFAFFSKLILGSLADRYSVRHLTIAIMLGSALGLCCLIGATSVWQLYVGYGVVYGIAGGAQNTLPGLIWPNYYGRQFLGAIRGLTSPFWLAASVGGPMFAAFIYDVSGSYTLAFWVFVACFVVAALLIWLARRPVPEGLMRVA
jgi:MFS family permease